MSNVECESCVKRKTMYCPNSFKCYATKYKPYWQNRIMLLEENNQLKEKYVNAVADYEEQKFNVEELKKQLEEYQLQNIDLRTDIMIQKKAFPNKEIKDKTFYNLFDMPTYEDLLNQQKEFIEYLEKEIKDMEEEIGNSITKPYKESHIIRKNVYQEILSKYKEIIGGKDENNSI